MPSVNVPEAASVSRRGVDECRLTARERQIVALIAVGSSNKQIASHLGITERTVKGHLTSIFKKLDLSNRLQLAIHAMGGHVPWQYQSPIDDPFAT
jgi:DNA-binding CsgD family transcriptional regulator